MEHSIPKHGDMNNRREIGGLVSGKLVLLVSLMALSTVPFITWATLRKVEADLAIGQPPLSWAQRDHWPSPPIQRTSLERPRSNYGRVSDNKWRDLDFNVPPAIEAATLTAHDLAADPAAFASPDTPALLQGLAEEYPDFFYPLYLLGTWHRVHGDPDQADIWYERAFALAPAIIKLRYIDPGNAPIIGLDVGAAEITCDRVLRGQLDQTLKLAYPHLVTDQRGNLYLPAFDAVFRVTQRPQAEGYAMRYTFESWFQFPGRIGAPKPIVVWRQPTAAAAAAR